MPPSVAAVRRTCSRLSTGNGSFIAASRRRDGAAAVSARNCGDRVHTRSNPRRSGPMIVALRQSQAPPPRCKTRRGVESPGRNSTALYVSALDDGRVARTWFTAPTGCQASEHAHDGGPPGIVTGTGYRLSTS